MRNHKWTLIEEYQEYINKIYICQLSNEGLVSGCVRKHQVWVLIAEGRSNPSDPPGISVIVVIKYRKERGKK